jgi:hypothetical protein
MEENYKPILEDCQDTPEATTGSDGTEAGGELNWCIAVGSQVKNTTGECTHYCTNTILLPVPMTPESASQGSNRLLHETIKMGKQCKCMKLTLKL